MLPAQRDEQEVVGREVGGTCDDREYVDEAAEAMARLAPIVDAAARGRNVSVHWHLAVESSCNRQRTS